MLTKFKSSHLLSSLGKGIGHYCIVDDGAVVSLLAAITTVDMGMVTSGTTSVGIDVLKLDGGKIISPARGYEICHMSVYAN